MKETFQQHVIQNAIKKSIVHEQLKGLSFFLLLIAFLVKKYMVSKDFYVHNKWLLRTKIILRVKILLPV